MGEASTQADLVILTILPEETSAVVAALSAHGSFHQVLGTNLYRWRSVELASNQGKLRVIVGSSGGAGNDKMQAAATDGLQRFKPHVLLVVGVAGGVPKGNDPMCAGDIVMGDAIWSIDRGSIDEKGLHVRPASQSAGWGMLPGMQNIALDAPDWAKDLTNADGTAPRLISGGIAATNYVLKVQEHELFEAITRATGNTVRAVEMESWGAAISGQAYTASSRKGVLLGMVRGLSDIVRPKPTAFAALATIASETPSSAGDVNSRERDDWKQRAANNAARLVVTWTSHAWPYDASAPSLSSEPSGRAVYEGNSISSNPGHGVATLPPQAAPVIPGKTSIQPLNPRDKALMRQKDDIEKALKVSEAHSFLDALCNDPHLAFSPKISDALDLINALDDLPLMDKMFAIQRATKGCRIPISPDGSVHPIEAAAAGLYLRAGILAVNLEAAKAFGMSSDALTVIPEKNETLIAVLMAALHGEVRAVSLREEMHETGPGSFLRVRGDNLIDLDALPLYPLMNEQALANELETRLGGQNLPAGVPTGNSANGSFDDSAARNDHIRFLVRQNREVHNKHFRFIVSHGESGFAQDDARCEEMFRKLGVPFARVVPGAADAANVEKVFGVTSRVLESLFRQFLDLLNQAKQTLRPEPSAPAANAAEMLQVLLALMKENEAVKAQLTGPIEKLEAKSGAPKTATLSETMETAKKSMETVNAYTGLWGQIYAATRTLLDILP